MWHSSTGDRTLQGCEAIQVAAAIETMIDALFVHIDEDSHEQEASIPECESGIAVYDRLSACQRIGLLHELATYLLTSSEPPLGFSAMTDAGVAALFVEIRDQIAIEIGLSDTLPPEDHFRWREMVCDALDESNQKCIAVGVEDLVAPPPRDCQEIDEWETVVDVLANDILWDRDFEMADEFMDEDPTVSDHRRKLMGIERDYFTHVAPDPMPDQAFGLVCETRKILRRVSP